MTFDLLPRLTPFLVLLGLVALSGATLAVAVLTRFFVVNHRTRVQRHQPLVGYYRHLALGH